MKKKFLLKTLLLLCALVVGSGSAWADTYEKVTASSQLVEGEEYLIVYEAGTSSAACGAISTTSTKYGLSVAVTISNSEITISSEAVAKFILGGSTGEWTFKNKSNNNYLTWSSGNSLNQTNTATTDAQKWTVNISSNSTTITNNSTSGTNTRYIKYNSTSGQERFACYTSGQQNITLYKKKVVSASPLASISVDASGSKTSYNVGETFSHDGVVVTATYEDNTTKNVSDNASFSSPDMSTTGDKTVTVSYTEGEITKTATYTINVHEYQQPTLFDIELNDSFFGTNYNGAASGITDNTPVSGSKDNVTVTYAGGGNHYIKDHIRIYPSNKLTFAAPTGYVITKIEFTSSGNWSTSITISANSGEYTSEDKTWEGEANSVVFTASGSSGSCYVTKATITLAVEKELESISLSGDYPTTFVEGADFSHEGLVVTATYKDNSTKVVTNEASFSTPDMTQIGEQTVTVTYKNKTASYQINISEKPRHNVRFYNNGQEITASAAQVKEGEAIEFPEAPTATVAGYEFLGWATAAIDGVSQNAPTTVTSATMGTADVDYYAVYANVVRTDITATFDASDISNLTSTGTRKWSDNATGIELYISNGQHYTNGTPNTWTVTKSTSSADYCLTIGKTGINIKTVRVTVSGTDYAVGDYYAYATTEDENGVDLTSTVTTNGTESTWNLSGNYELVALWSSTSYQLRATLIEVEAEDNVISGYRTTIPAPTAVVSAAGWATWNAPCAVSFPEGVNAYLVTENSNPAKVSLIEVSDVPANTPVLLEASAGTYTMTSVESSTTSTADNLLRVSTGTNIESAMYVLAKIDNVVGFYMWDKTKGGDLPEGKIYLEMPSGARPFIALPGEETGISDMNRETITNNRYFDLQGRRVAQPTKGMYIVNGKKVVVK